ncbi:MAG TPA: hypothetical protein VLI54_06715 [Bacillota bacterium]|nr:hypothetical protein [Bacillota bacterium]
MSIALPTAEANHRLLRAYNLQGSYLPDVPICPDLGIAATQMIRATQPMEPDVLARLPYAVDTVTLRSYGNDSLLHYRPDSLPISDEDRRRKLGVVTVGLLTAIDQLALGPDGARLPDEIPRLLPDDEPIRRAVVWLGLPGNALLCERALAFASRAIYGRVESNPQVAAYKNSMERTARAYNTADFAARPELRGEFNSEVANKRLDVSRHLRSVVTRELELAAMPALHVRGLPLSQHQLFVFGHNLTRPAAASEWNEPLPIL